MTGLLGLAVVVIVLLVSGWWLSWIATRLDRAHSRVERSWAVLDATLVRRAQRATDLSRDRPLDRSADAVRAAASRALEPDLSHHEREAAESALTRVLDRAALPGLEREQDRAVLARRLHNDAVSTAQALRHRPVVRIFRLAGWAAEPKPFEMAEASPLVWSGGE